MARPAVVTCYLIAKPHEAGIHEKGRLILQGKVPEWVRIFDRNGDRRTWGPLDWWHTRALPHIWDRLGEARYLAVAKYPDGRFVDIAIVAKPPAPVPEYKQQPLL